MTKKAGLPWTKEDGVDDIEFAFACGFASGWRERAREDGRHMVRTYKRLSPDAQPIIHQMLLTFGMQYYLDASWDPHDVDLKYPEQHYVAYKKQLAMEYKK